MLLNWRRRLYCRSVEVIDYVDPICKKYAAMQRIGVRLIIAECKTFIFHNKIDLIILDQVKPIWSCIETSVHKLSERYRTLIAVGKLCVVLQHRLGKGAEPPLHPRLTLDPPLG